MTEILDTHRRALAVNLDPTSYGTFAEIGAGQEVARWFLHVGAAAGSVAKTISAYDMAFSDAIYGKGSRYVSRERLVKMLDHEYPLLLSRLGRARGDRSRFFVFADTVAARNYAGTNECHGWMGLRFQTKPGARPSQVVLHVNLRDPSNIQQQQALGILGVNLVYAAFFETGKRGRVLESLFAGLSLDRIEIDFVELSGPAFAGTDEREVGVELLRKGLAHAIAITRSGDLVPPTEFLRKNPIVLERRAMRDATPVSGRGLAATAREFARERPELERAPLALFELPLVAGPDSPLPPAALVLRRIAQLRGRGFPVLVTRYPKAFRLTEYVRRYTQEPMILAFTAAALVEFLHAGRNREQAGGAFEALGKLLRGNVRTFVQPQTALEFRAALRRAGLDPKSVSFPPKGPVRADNIGLPPPLDHLLAYLLGAGWVVPLGSPAAKKPSAAKAVRARK